VSSFTNTRDVNLEWNARRGMNYVIIPSYFLGGITGKFWLNIFSFHISNSLTPHSSEHKPHEIPINTVTVMSKWVRGITAGGSPQYPTWIYSPQFLFHNPHREPLEFTMQLIPTEHSHTLPLCGFFIFPAEQHRKQIFDLSNIVYTSKFTDQKSTSTVLLEIGWYNISCCTLEPGVEFSFEFSIKGSLPNNALTELNSSTNWKMVSVQGLWDGHSSGCSKFKEQWRNNPLFRLDVTEKSPLQIVLDSEKVYSAVGYYIFRTNDGETPLQLVGQTQFIKSRLGERSLASKLWTLDRASYLLIPTTFEAKERAYFSLQVYTEREEKIKLIPLMTTHHTHHK